MTKASILLAVATVVCFGADPNALRAQEVERGTEYVQFEDGSNYWIRLRVGHAFVFESQGPSPRPQAGPVRHRWFTVQDSALGVVFRRPSGFKAAERTFDGDILAATTVEVHAVEFGVITFNIWNEYTGTWFVTEPIASEAGDNFSLNPSIYPCRFDPESPTGITCYNLYKHFISITYVSRVRYYDGSIVIADPQPAFEAAKLFSDDVTLEDLEPEAPLIPLPPDQVQT